MDEVDTHGVENGQGECASMYSNAVYVVGGCAEVQRRLTAIPPSNSIEPELCCMRDQGFGYPSRRSMLPPATRTYHSLFLHKRRAPGPSVARLRLHTAPRVRYTRSPTVVCLKCVTLRFG